MYLTQQSKYALKVLIYVATNADSLVQISMIAKDYQISKSHLMKVVPCLVRGGFLIGIRGKGGGLKLAKPPEELVIGQVIRHTENLQIIRESSESQQGAYYDQHLAPIFQQAAEAFLQKLEQYTLADII